MLRKQILLLGKQKMFLPGVKNIFASRTQILRPKHMFPSLAGNITRNIVSATMFPSLARPLNSLLENNTTNDGKIFLTCVQMATLARLPNDVLTAREERPKPENRVEKAVVRVILGLSSATTTQLRTQVKLTPLAYEERRANPIIIDQYNITVSGQIGERLLRNAKWPLRAVDSNAKKSELLQYAICLRHQRDKLSYERTLMT